MSAWDYYDTWLLPDDEPEAKKTPDEPDEYDEWSQEFDDDCDYWKGVMRR